MKNYPVKMIISFVMIMLVSCDEPETVVTNIVHYDGSVTRRIEMRNIENKFEKSDIQVPIDTTWTVRDSCESDESTDSVWIRRAEKNFKNVDEINLAYSTDSGANKAISRRATFKKTFKWFNTEFRFAEIIDKKMDFGYPVSDFLDEEELLFFYSPEVVNHEKRWGPDSLKFKALSDSVDNKVEIWETKNLVSGWFGEFSRLTQGDDDIKSSLESFKLREDELVDLIRINENQIDSLWDNGIILKDFLGEAVYEKYRTEADSAFKRVIEKYYVDFKEYSVRIIMPGTVTETNGFIDSSEVLLWPVKSDYFLTETYEMWAESKIPNRWAWFVSGLFLLFVLTGLIIRLMKKG